MPTDKVFGEGQAKKALLKLIESELKNFTSKDSSITIKASLYSTPAGPFILIASSYRHEKV